MWSSDWIQLECAIGKYLPNVIRFGYLVEASGKGEEENEAQQCPPASVRKQWENGKNGGLSESSLLPQSFVSALAHPLSSLACAGLVWATSLAFATHLGALTTLAAIWQAQI